MARTTPPPSAFGHCLSWLLVAVAIAVIVVATTIN